MNTTSMSSREAENKAVTWEKGFKGSRDLDAQVSCPV